MFDKIKNFFKRLFSKDKLLNPGTIIEEPKSVSDKNQFQDNIVVKEDEERLRLLKIQEEFSKGNILEEDIDEDDLENLHILYDEQISKIKDSIENYKNETLKIMKELKSS